MELNSITHNGYEVIAAYLLANVTAQIAKTFVNAVKHRKWDSRMLYSTGGMPSSHSATVTAMATSIGLISGWDSTVFALSVGLASVVMYDAQGVRLAASRQAEILNTMLKEIFNIHPTLKGKRLKELLGHTPMQVVVGATLGILTSFAWHWYLTGMWGRG